MSLAHDRIDEDHCPHFVTFTVVDWLPVFTQPEIAQIVLDAWSFLQEHERMQLFAYIILEYHIQFIASGDNLAQELESFKAYTAQRAVDLLEATNSKALLQRLAARTTTQDRNRKYDFWQDSSTRQQISGNEALKQKVTQIHVAPMKRGYVDDPTHWRYSSARNYAGQPGLIDVKTDWLTPET